MGDWPAWVREALDRISTSADAFESTAAEELLAAFAAGQQRASAGAGVDVEALADSAESAATQAMYQTGCTVDDVRAVVKKLREGRAIHAELARQGIAAKEKPRG